MILRGLGSTMHCKLLILLDLKYGTLIQRRQIENGCLSPAVFPNMKYDAGRIHVDGDPS
jgi:hypothetical protein